LSINGHTDNTGGDDLNLKLSQDRADAAKQYLVNQGISADRITAIGYGSSKPIQSNDTEEGRSKNRRVEFKLKF
jgi:outer membrane protein OmpA-like peptidoglycan-associated protein